MRRVVSNDAGVRATPCQSASLLKEHHDETYHDYASAAVTWPYGLIVEPGGGYHEHGYWDGGHGDAHVERGY